MDPKMDEDQDVDRFFESCSGKELLDYICSHSEVLRCPMSESSGAISRMCARILVNSMVVLPVSSSNYGDFRDDLPIDKKEFLDSFITMYMLMDSDLFDHLEFAKTLCHHCQPLPIELLWRLHSSGMLVISLYLIINDDNSVILRQFSKSVSNLIICGQESLLFARKIITDVCSSLIMSAYPTRCIQSEEYLERSKKVTQLMLNEITINILEFIYSRNPTAQCSISFIMYELLRECGVIDSETMIYFCEQQVGLILTYHPLYEVQQALTLQESWRFSQSSNPLAQLFIQLMVPLEISNVTVLLQQISEKRDCNLEALLRFVSLFVVLFTNGGHRLKGIINKILQHSFEVLDNQALGKAMLFARQASMEGTNVFPSYGDWFQSVFGSSSNSLIGTKKTFTFFINFLNDIIPYEQSHFLKVHINRPPYIIPKCQQLYSDYAMLARTRLSDLKELEKRQSDRSDQNQIEETRAASDVDNAIHLFQKHGKIPSCVMELSMFHTQYFVRRFLPALLKPRTIPHVPDDRMKFIDALLNASRIPSAMHAEYLNLCKRN